ncbi:uncharacterized protein LOC129741885 [Uranotaenia lowii]|uniref:uncharacterized protein LOC129741885 n=1 Tax=Uranotaenia lowii TaxID=190385 RepID=UPI002478C5EB|nr:uncharacterized protein LOC129741885 [Uranotaenia lowii]
MSRSRVKSRFFNTSIINGHSPYLGCTGEDKDKFYAQLDLEYDRCPKPDIKIVIGDFNAQVCQEKEFKLTIRRFSTHQLTNENGLRLIDFATSKRKAIDNVFIDTRHFSDIIDCQGANKESDHYLVMLTMRPKLSGLGRSSILNPTNRPAQWTSHQLKTSANTNLIEHVSEVPPSSVKQGSWFRYDVSLTD